MFDLVAELAKLDTTSRFIVNYATVFGYCLLGVAIFLMLVFPAIQMVQDFKKAIGALVGLVLMGLIFFLCYSMGTAEELTVISGDKVETIAAGTMKIVDACIFMAYTLLVGAILVLILTSFARYIKQ